MAKLDFAMISMPGNRQNIDCLECKCSVRRAGRAAIKSTSQGRFAQGGIELYRRAPCTRTAVNSCPLNASPFHIEAIRSRGRSLVQHALPSPVRTPSSSSTLYNRLPTHAYGSGRRGTGPPWHRIESRERFFLYVSWRLFPYYYR